jgi:hypothetical protein
MKYVNFESSSLQDSVIPSKNLPKKYSKWFGGGFFKTVGIARA